MRQNLFAAIYLKPAMEQPGCPICRVRNTAEEKYLGNLLHESVNDFETRLHIFNSLGYCTKHAWQMGVMERQKYGDALGNSIIYESLVKVIIHPLARYQSSLPERPQTLFRRLLGWLKRIGGTPDGQHVDPFEGIISGSCRVCQIGARTVENYLGWMLEGLSEPEQDLREIYRRSDGLCLAHFRQALSIQRAELQNGRQFLVQRMLEVLPVLGANLREYTDKHAWDRRLDAMTPDEQIAWIKAIRFFSGNEGNILMEEMKDIPPDDRTKQDLTGLYG